jgi:hypothetical protein
MAGRIGRSFRPSEQVRNLVIWQSVGKLTEQPSWVVNYPVEEIMQKLALTILISLAAAACQTPQQTAGTTTGVVAGAAVGGPVGAVVGGAVGATVTAPGTTLGGPAPAGYCYVTDRAGRVIVDARGNPRLRRC